MNVEPLADGYRYTLWVCEVARQVTERVLRLQPRAFSYRGASLESSFAKGVYFLLMNDQCARELYSAQLRGTRAPPFDLTTTSGEVLAEYLSQCSEGDACSVPTLQGALATVAHYLGSMTAWICAQFLLLEPRYRGPVWAIAIQPKFVGLLLPIVRALGAQFRFVTIDDPVTGAHLRELGYDHTNIGPGRETVTCGRRRSKLGLVHSQAVAFDAVYRHMRAMRPSGVIVPEGNAPIYDVVNQVARQLGVPVVCVQQGWSPIVHSGFRNLSYTSMIVWGDWFAKALAPFSRGQRFAALGHHLINLHDVKKGRPETIGFFLQPITWLNSDDAWRSMFELISFAASRLPGARVLVRDHPNGPLNDGDKALLAELSAVEYLPPERASLQAVLERCDIVVSLYSTTILEGIGAGALPLIVNATTMPSYYPDLQSLGAGIEVRTFEQAEAALAEIWSGARPVNAESIETMQRALFSCAGTEALVRIVSHLQQEFGLATIEERSANS